MDGLFSFDMGILFWIENHLVNSTLNPYMIELSSLGDFGKIWIFLSIILLSIKKYRWVGISIILALVLSLIFGNGILKPLVARVRPYMVYPGISILNSLPMDYSFPSGHAFASFAAAITIYCQNRKFGLMMLVVAVGIGFSRMYLFVHYPSDVAVGAILGIISGIVAYKLSRYLEEAWSLRKISTMVKPNVVPVKNGIRRN